MAHLVFLTDSFGRVVLVNQAFLCFLGVSEENLLGTRWLERVHEGDRDRILLRWEESLATQSPFREEVRMLRANETYGWLDLEVRPRGEDGWVASATDIDESLRKVEGLAIDRRELAESLHQLGEGLREAQKMESIGRLAAGVAHDFNNLLTIIMACTEELLETTGEGDAAREPLLECRLATRRASSLTRDLLAMSRRQRTEPRTVDLNQVVTETERLLGRLMGEDVVLKVVLDPNVGAVVIDPAHWTSVLVNLAVNARHAMATGGVLTITTKSIGHDHAQIEVADTGCGFDEVVAEHLFDPFFTTKQPGRGVGLGLAMVQNIVRESGGTIAVTSKPGAGTTFRIDLPLSREKPTMTARSFPVPAQSTETVLLVEDEEHVREAIRRALAAHGFKVLAAADAEEALACLETTKATVDILVTDVVLPKMNGRGLVDLVRQSHPSIKVLYTSGYMDDAIASRGVDCREVAFVAKPYTARQLIQQMRRLLDEAARATAPGNR